MLVLSLREGKRIHFRHRETGAEIGVVTFVLAQDEGRVARLGFDFVPTVEILRDSLLCKDAPNGNRQGS